MVGETRTVSGEVPEGAEIWSKGGYHTNEWSSEERRVEGRPYGGAIVERNCRCSSGGRGDKSVFVFGLCPVCREDVIDEVWGGGQERWDGHLSRRPGTQQRTATSGCSRGTIAEGGLQVSAAGLHGHAGVTGGLGSQMVAAGSGGSSGGSCKMGGWEQYAGAHWGVIRETLHIRRDRRCSAGRGHTCTMSFSRTYVAQ